MQLGLLACADVCLFNYKRPSIDKNVEGLLVDRPVAPKLDKYVGLDPT